MSNEILVKFNREDLEKICKSPYCRVFKYCLRSDNDLIRCNLIEPRNFKMLDKTYDPLICCLVMQNPCTDCRDKSKCLDCPKACEYVQAIYNELVRKL
jgi:hypothetical protein